MKNRVLTYLIILTLLIQFQIGKIHANQVKNSIIIHNIIGDAYTFHNKQRIPLEEGKKISSNATIEIPMDSTVKYFYFDESNNEFNDELLIGYFKGTFNLSSVQFEKSHAKDCQGGTTRGNTSNLTGTKLSLYHENIIVEQGTNRIPLLPILSDPEIPIDYKSFKYKILKNNQFIYIDKLESGLNCNISPGNYEIIFFDKNYIFFNSNLKIILSDKTDIKPLPLPKYLSKINKKTLALLLKNMYYMGDVNLNMNSPEIESLNSQDYDFESFYEEVIAKVKTYQIISKNNMGD